MSCITLCSQYFKFGSNFGPRDVDARRVGGMIDLANYCPYHQPILVNNQVPILLMVLQSFAFSQTTAQILMIKYQRL